MKVELLYFDACPGYEALVGRLPRLLAEMGVDAPVGLRHIDTPEQAEAERFLGSPTLRINGRDIEPGARERTDFGLKCRLYRTPSGTSPLPPEEWILAALGSPGAGLT